MDKELIYSIFFNAEDVEWVCITENFPGYSWMATTPEEALRLYRENFVADFAEPAELYPGEADGYK